MPRYKDEPLAKRLHVTDIEELMFKRYTRIRGDGADARVVLQIDVQSFTLEGDYDDLDHITWTRWMLARALAKVYEDHKSDAEWR